MIVSRTPLEPTSFCDVATVRREIGSVDSADDAILHDLIRQASAAVEDHLHRKLALADIVETIRLDRPVARVVLAQRPVVSVLAVSLDGAPVSNATAEAESGQLFRSDLSEFPAGVLAVEYAAGYTMPGQDGRSLPEPVERATIETVKYWYFARAKDPLVRSEKVDVLETSYFQNASVGGLPPGLETILQPLKNLPV